MYKYNIYIGMYDKDTKKQEFTTQDFLNIVQKVMRLKDIKNYTIYKCKGHYQHEDGTTVCEPSINVEIISDSLCIDVLDKIKFKLCKELNQESVLITKQDIEVL